MFPNSPVFPPVASKLAPQVDALFFYAVGVSVFFTVLIVLVILGFVAKYRRRRADEVGHEVHEPAILEIGWTVVPLVLVMICCFWGMKVFFYSARPPANAAQFYVYGKQWMWKMEHPEGKREINELHVPLGQPIRLTMTSEDVIHNFSIPAFRLKMDVLPGRYTTAWFEATQTGTFYIFCDQYCGVEHSKMAGKVVVMPPAEYRAWLANTAPGGATAVASGDELFVQKACNTCHRSDSSARAPILHGVAGKAVTLLDGSTVVADATYLRESILNPAAKVVKGYQPIMPTYKDQLSEEEVMQLIKYIETLKPVQTADLAAGGK